MRLVGGVRKAVSPRALDRLEPLHLMVDDRTGLVGTLSMRSLAPPQHAVWVAAPDHAHDFVHGKAHWLASGRPTVREHPIDRVTNHLMTDVATVDATTIVAQAIPASRPSDDARLVVVGADRVVLGTITVDRLRDEDADAPVADIMRLGPTTIRPDELTDAVRARMASRNVRWLLVTTPRGELLGSFAAS